MINTLKNGIEKVHHAHRDMVEFTLLLLFLGALHLGYNALADQLTLMPHLGMFGVATAVVARYAMEHDILAMVLAHSDYIVTVSDMAIRTTIWMLAFSSALGYELYVIFNPSHPENILDRMPDLCRITHLTIFLVVANTFVWLFWIFIWNFVVHGTAFYSAPVAV